MSMDLLLNLSDPVVVTTLEHEIVYVNTAYETLSGYRKDELIGSKAKITSSGLTPRWVYQGMYSALMVKNAWSGIVTNRHKKGSIYHSHLSITKVRDLDEEYYVGIARRLESITQGSYFTEEMIRSFQSSVIATLAKLAESDEPDIEGHLHRVGQYASRLAILAKNEQIEGADDFLLAHIEEASLLHDIGKIKIPKSILYKPNKLSNAEFNLVKDHTVYGSEIIKSITAHINEKTQNVLSLARIISRSHHEWWNGKGYPDQLSGHSIHLSARIVTIADVLDALRSPRPYKASWTDERILTYFEQRSGNQFDPQLTSIFLKNFSLFHLDSI